MACVTQSHPFILRNSLIFILRYLMAQKSDEVRKKSKVISLLTNDMTMEVEDIIDIYRQRWEIELLFYRYFLADFNIHHFRSTYKLLDFCYPKTLYQIVSKI